MAKNEDDGIVSFMLGLIAGTIGGVVAGLLFAPKSGDELREDLQGFVKGLPQKLDDEINNPQGKTRTIIDKARYNIENQVDRVRKDRDAEKQAKAKVAEELASGYDFH